MKMLNKLLDQLGSRWYKLAKELPLITITQAAGEHCVLTVTSKQLVLHSTPYHEGMPVKQAFNLDNYTLDQLVAAITSLGYAVSLTEEAISKQYGTYKASILLETVNTVIVSPCTIKGFTSNLWQLLYPLARLLDENDINTSEAINQLYLSTTSGGFVDYWATFFKLTRSAGETDMQLRHRILVALSNIKTNNIALQQLIQLLINGPAEIVDTEPASFDVVLDPAFISAKNYIVEVVDSIRAGGIAFALNYKSSDYESYQAYFSDAQQQDFTQSDQRTVQSIHSTADSSFRLAATSFKLNRNKLVTDPIKMLAAHEILNIENSRCVSTSETYSFNRTSRDYRVTSFKLNTTGRLNSQTTRLHGVLNSGDVQNLVGVALSEKVKTPTATYGNKVTAQENTYPVPGAKTANFGVVSTEAVKTYAENVSGAGMNTTEAAYPVPSARAQLGVDDSEHTYRIAPTRFKLNRHRIITDKVKVVAAAALNDKQSIGVSASDTYSLNRLTPDRTVRSFKLNSGVLNSPGNKLFGQSNYGDIIKLLTTHAEIVSVPEAAASYSAALIEPSYREPRIKGLAGFRIGYSSLNSSAKLSRCDEQVFDKVAMTLVKAGVTIKSASM